MISKGFASLYELQTVYSYNDLLDLIEIAVVNAENERIAFEENGKK